MATQHTFKNHRNVLETKMLTPMKALRLNCIMCAGGSAAEVRACDISDCPCFPFRFGKRPKA